jgi:hypothetical protein
LFVLAENGLEHGAELGLEILAELGHVVEKGLEHGAELGLEILAELGRAAVLASGLVTGAEHGLLNSCPSRGDDCSLPEGRDLAAVEEGILYFWLPSIWVCFIERLRKAGH